MTPADSARIELTQGNLDNYHFYLRDHLHLFPQDAIGPPNQADGLGRTVEVHYDGLAEPSQTDINGAPTKLFFRRRGPFEPFSSTTGCARATSSS